MKIYIVSASSKFDCEVIACFDNEDVADKFAKTINDDTMVFGMEINVPDEVSISMINDD